MSETASRLIRLHQRLAELFKAPQGPNVRLLPDNQMLIDKNIVPNPAFGRGSKMESSVPSRAGYRIYVAYRSPDEYAAAMATSQRISGPAEQPIVWDAKSTALRVDKASLKPEWRLLNAEGQVVTVNVHCGSTQVVSEVNVILTEIETTLLS